MLNQSVQKTSEFSMDNKSQAVRRDYPVVTLLKGVSSSIGEQHEANESIAKAITEINGIYEDLYQTRTRAENWCNELIFARDELKKANIDCKGKHGEFIHYGIRHLLANKAGSDLAGLTREELLSRTKQLLDELSGRGILDELDVGHGPDMINRFCDMIELASSKRTG